LRHEAITRDFIADGGRGVVIAPSNVERQDLNRRIREALIDAGRVEKQSVKVPVVVRQDLTREQKGHASSYGAGDVLRFVRPGQGIEAGERARVISIDERKNLLRLELETSRLVRVINPKHRRAFQVERVEQRRFAVGDRIQFRARDRSLDVANGTLGTIKKLDHERAVATVEVGPRRFRLDLKEPRALDHAYAVTSHRSQGLSRERVYPAFRSVSTPRRTKDLPVVGPVDPGTGLGMAGGCASASEWSAKSLSARLRRELTPRAWDRLVRLSACRGTSVEQLLRSTLSEVA
jgi:hypothetical protein